jgi:hypothetical protein
VRITSSIHSSIKELSELHRPDNGLTQTCLEISTYRSILIQLKQLKGEKSLFVESPSKGMQYLEDDSIVGNPDRMLFYTKEFLAAVEDS